MVTLLKILAMPSPGKAFFFAVNLIPATNPGENYFYMWNMQRNIKKYSSIQILGLCCFFLLVIFFRGSAQKPKMPDKIDPVFRKLMQTTNIKNCPPVYRKFTRRKNTTRKPAVLKKASADIKYDCIVYTKSANSLRAKGVTINSVLPTFVTASATLCQILQMSASSEVTYIEAPRMDQLH